MFSRKSSEMAYADRDLFVADPDFVEVPTRAMLNADYLKSRAGLSLDGFKHYDGREGRRPRELPPR